MKPSSLFAFFFLFAFITSSAKAEFVVDVEGDNVVNGGAYYFLPKIWASDGGLELERTGNETYSLSVVQRLFEIDNGFPWRITSPLKIRFIPTYTDLDFFSVEGELPSCVPVLSKWSIVEGEDGIMSVKTSGLYEKNTLKGWFKIQQDSNRAYKIVFCPINDDSCAHLGISRDRRLVITNDDPLIVVFVKAESSQV